MSRHYLLAAREWGITAGNLPEKCHALGLLAVSVSMLLSFATIGFAAALSRCSVSLLLFCNTRSRCCSFATFGLAAALSRRSVSLLLFRDARSRCCSFVTLGLAAALSRRLVSLLFRDARSRCPSSSAVSFQPLFETGRMCIEHSPTSKGHSWNGRQSGGRDFVSLPGGTETVRIFVSFSRPAALGFRFLRHSGL